VNFAIIDIMEGKMKEKLQNLAIITIIIFSFAISSCPELEETTSGIVNMSYSGALEYRKWLEILDEINEQTSFVNLDLSNCTTATTAGTHHAFFEYTHHGRLFRVFTPLPWLTHHNDPNHDESEKEDIRSAKSKIVSITLPRSATAIDLSTQGQQSSAFRDFTYLRSVTGESIDIVGSYAFFGLKNLREVNFSSLGTGPSMNPAPSAPASTSGVSPTQGHFAQVDDFAFAECSALKRINFPNARIIGKSAFENSGLTTISSSDLSNAWIIFEGAFRGCRDLASVYFRNVTKIGDEAFAYCTGLKTAVFAAGPEKGTAFPINASFVVDFKSVIFYQRVFIGSKAFQRLEIPNAWNVYFATDALANIGSHLDLLLFDHDKGSTSGNAGYGHPQIEDFLGNRLSLPGSGSQPRTINSVKLILPKVNDIEESQVMYGDDETIGGKEVATIFNDLRGRYGDFAVKVTVERY
jgi:hypothetical protein